MSYKRDKFSDNAPIQKNAKKSKLQSVFPGNYKDFARTVFFEMALCMEDTINKLCLSR